MFAAKYQIHGVKINRKYMCESKKWISSFLLMLLSKTLPETEGNYVFQPNSIFWKSLFPTAEREKDQAEKNN